jgi:hypothetical protein
MDSIYQLIFFLAIALLAIVITVFVLAVSLLGRAVKLSTEEQIQAEERRKKDTEDEIKKMQDKLEKAKAAGRVDVKDLTRSLQDLEGRDTRHKWKLRWIKIKPKLLTANWGALIPGALFLIAAIFSGLALNQPGETATASLYMWVSLIALVIGICFVCLTLKVIQGVAITSEETAFVRQKEMFKEALVEFEAERKAELEFTFTDSQPPFHMKPESEIVIKFEISVTRGDIARHTEVFFMAPKGFEFPDSDEALPPRGYEELANYISARIEFKDIPRGIYRKGTVKLKAPSQTNNYPLYYSCLCEGYDGGINKFEIVVT